MTLRNLASFISCAVLLAACGGGSDEPASDAGVAISAPAGTTASSAGATTAAPAGTAAAGDAAGTNPAATTPPAEGGGQVDPRTADPCAILTLDEVSAALGATASDPINYYVGSTDIAECNFTLNGGEAVIAFQIDLVLPPGSQTVTNGTPLDIGNGGSFSDSSYPFAIADINGWLVRLSGVSGPVTAEQLQALGNLLVVRITERTGAGAPPPVPSGSGDGTCTVEVTGALSDSITGTQAIGAAYSSLWVPAEQQAQADAMFPGGAPDFQVSCAGGSKNGSALISLVDVEVPFGAATVDVPANMAGYFSDEGIVGNAEPIQITLTKFDETGMAGSFTFTGDGLGTGVSTVTVTFDFVNDVIVGG
jgi:hypothetical protein